MQQGLLSAFNPSDALPAPRYTGMLLPIERDMYGTKGNFELAVPQFLQDAYSGINKFGQAFRGELSPQELQQLAFDTSMNVTGGSLLGSRVIPNAVPKGGVLSMGLFSGSNATDNSILQQLKTLRSDLKNASSQAEKVRIEEQITALRGQREQQLNNARKQANIERFGYDPNEVVDTSYRLQHKPNPDGARLDDMTKGGEVFPDDIYSSNGLLYYGNPKSLADRQSFEVIQKVKGNPDAEVTIYRAVPNQDNITTINSGDFVTLSEDYAKLHGQSGYGVDGSEAGKILSKKVKVRDLFSEGNDLNEFGYFPSKETTAQTGLLGKVNKSSNIFGSVEKFPNLSKQEENLVSSSFAPVNEVAGFGKVKIEKINNQDLVGSQKRFEELKELTANYAHDRAKARVIRLDNGENAIQYMQPPTEIKNVNVSDLIATQDNIVLGTNKSSGSPLVVKKNGKLYIRDGHHRIAQKINAGDKTAEVRVIDLDEGGYYGMDKSATEKIS